MPKKKVKTKVSDWITKNFTVTVKIVSITPISMLSEIEMVDEKGNIIIWRGSNFDETKFYVNNELTITGKPKFFIENDDVKKTVIKHISY
jgi:hypothetical protein|tara:strand:+ start:10287 stop:10556 length:270 start_codon:yes stop_codon:yes gene_type:complete